MSDEKLEIEETKPESKPKKSKMVHARAIASSGSSVLIEWNDGKWKRGYIPVSEFDREKSRVPENVLKAAIPYGVDWSKADVKIDLERLDQDLKRSGFWTVDDLKSNPQVVNVIIMRAAGLSREALKKVQEAK